MNNLANKHSILFLTVSLILLVVGCTSVQRGVEIGEPTNIESMNIELWDPSGVDAFPNATVGNGVLKFSDDCAVLVLRNNTAVLLVWPKPTSWNSETQSIEYVSPQGDTLALQNGDKVIPGGMSSNSLGLDTDCEVDEVFIVSELRLTSP